MAGDPTFSFSPHNPVLVQRHVGLDAEALSLMKSNGCRIVHDIDDLLWAIPPQNPNVHELPPALLRRMHGTLRTADLVTASTEPLALALTRARIDSVVVPNLLDPYDWPVEPMRTDRKRLRVGWYGQKHVHDEDLDIIATVVSSLADQVDFVFYGDVPKALSVLGRGLEVYPPTSIELFPSTLAALDLDILLSPLVKNQFNECKSNLRALQAGILGYAVIATDIEPHRTLPVTLVSNDPAAWVRAIRERVGEIDAVRAEGRKLQEIVKEFYTINDSWSKRIYENWTGSPPIAA